MRFTVKHPACIWICSENLEFAAVQIRSGKQQSANHYGVCYENTGKAEFMKYIVVLGDGMADLDIKELGNKTILDVANKPNIDALAKKGIIGMARTVPKELKPGSDVANLAVMGYNPLECYTGRSPLEAVSIGIKMKATDVAIRCNLVTLSNEENIADRTMADYSAGEISTDEAAELIKAVEAGLGNNEFRFYKGISYRHCLIWDNGKTDLALTPPHDISDRTVGEYLPKNEKILDLVERSYEILKDHPINLNRKAEGKNPANSIWLWGEGTKPKIDYFEKKNGLKGTVISAVDLIKGIGISAGMTSIDVKGATGTLDTNYEGKFEAAKKALLQDGNDFVYIHLEGPDECGHHGDIKGKILSVERIDKRIVGPLCKAMEEVNEDFAMLIMPDHPTPIATKTHSSEPVPFLIYRSNDEKSNGNIYNEKNAKSSGLFIEEGYTLLSEFINNSL